MDSYKLSDRMQNNYESRANLKLMRNVPVIIKLKCMNYKSITKGFTKPFDSMYLNVLKRSVKKLCSKVQGCKMAYVYMDEVILVLTDYDNKHTKAWFDYNAQKLCSTITSIMTREFNTVLKEMVDIYALIVESTKQNCTQKAIQMCSVYSAAAEEGAYFTASCFNIPKVDVVNYLYYKQVCALNHIRKVLQCNVLENSRNAGYGFCVVKNSIKGNPINLRDENKDSNAWIVCKDTPKFNSKNGMEFIRLATDANPEVISID